MEKKQYWNRLSAAVQLQSEPLPGLPLVEIAGDCRVLIEQHQGVMKYDCRQICVNTSFGQVQVSGCDLTLSQMTRAQLVITGRIDAVVLKRRNGE